MWRILSIKKESLPSIWQEAQSVQNTPEVVEALKGIDVLLMVSARENPERVKEHKEFLDAAKLAGVQHIVYTSFYGADEKATFTLSRDHAQTEAYIKELGFTYTFLRDNFYLDFLIDMALENGEIRGVGKSNLESDRARGSFHGRNRSASLKRDR